MSPWGRAFHGVLPVLEPGPAAAFERARRNGLAAVASRDRRNRCVVGSVSWGFRGTACAPRWSGPERLEPRKNVADQPAKVQLWRSGARPWVDRRWAVLRARSPGALVLREIDVDAGAMNALRARPTMTVDELRAEGLLRVHDAPLDSEALDSRLQAASKIVVPLIGIQEPSGCDGVMSGLVIEGGLPRIELSWWSSVPEEWKGLVRWAEELRAFFEQRSASNRVLRDRVGSGGAR